MPMDVYGQGRSARAMWSAMDALVLKWVALQVESKLPRPEACHHLKGKGIRQNLREVSHALHSKQYRFVHRTDLRGYYRNINKVQLTSLLSRYVTDPICYELIIQYINYSVESGGEIHTPSSGIPRGCALSPLFGGSLLHHIDDFTGVWIRMKYFMSDTWMIFCFSLAHAGSYGEILRGWLSFSTCVVLSDIRKKRRPGEFIKALTGWVSDFRIALPP